MRCQPKMFIWRLYVDFADGIYSRERSVTLTSVSQLGIRPPQEPAAATQLRHLYSLGSWVRMWLRTFRSRKNILLQSYTAERERERETDEGSAAYTRQQRRDTEDTNVTESASGRLASYSPYRHEGN